MIGKGKNAGWRPLLSDLEDIDQIVLADAGHLPGKTIADLLSILTTLTSHAVAVVVPSDGIDTATGAAAVLALAKAYRAAKRSAAIGAGQRKAKHQGRHIGRPAIRADVRQRIVAGLMQNLGTRAAARKYSVSPATIVAIRNEMVAVTAQQAA